MYHVRKYHAMLLPAIHAPVAFSSALGLQNSVQKALDVTHDRRWRTLQNALLLNGPAGTSICAVFTQLIWRLDTSLATLEAAKCRWLLTDPSVSIVD
jgi:hypothetical protein